MPRSLFAILLLLPLALPGCGYNVLVTRAGQPVPHARVFVAANRAGQGPYLTDNDGIAHVPLLSPPVSVSAIAPDGESRSVTTVGAHSPFHIDLTFDAPPPSESPGPH